MIRLPTLSPKTWLMFAMVLAAAITLSYGLHLRSRAMQAERELEAAKLQAAGLLESEQASVNKLQSMADAVAAANAQIASQKATLDKLAKAKPERVYVLRSDPKPATGLLNPGDKTRFRVNVLDYRTSKGNLTVMGEAALDRLDPNAAVEVARGTFTSEAGSVVEERKQPVGKADTHWAVRGGVEWDRVQKAPDGEFVGLDRRLFGHLWATVETHVSSNPSAGIGLRWEW